MTKKLYFNSSITQTSNIHTINNYNLESPNSAAQNTPIISHPTTKKLSGSNTELSFSESGALLSNKPIKLLIKNKQAANGSVPTKDVSINGTYILRSVADINPVGGRNQDLPTLLQETGMCQSIPFLHIIQSQLNFPMDYKALWDCLSDDFYTFGIGAFAGDPNIKNYYKLFHLLFSGECFSIKEYPCRDVVTEHKIGSKPEKYDCDNACSIKIKIKTVKEPPIYTQDKLCERILMLGPRTIVSEGLTTMRLTVLAENPNLTWDMVIGMSFTELNTHLRKPWTTTFGMRHALTIVGCSDGKVQIKNSWGKNNEIISIPFVDVQQFFNLNQGLYDSFYGIDVDKYYPIVKICSQSTEELNKCREEICKDKGYDKVKSTGQTDDCYCDCDELTTPVDTYFPCLNKGQAVQLVLRRDKFYDKELGDYECRCPEHPNPNSFKYRYIRYNNIKFCCEEEIIESPSSSTSSSTSSSSSSFDTSSSSSYL